ncbi:Scm3p KNAG_0C03980 [Huiozyma naganishii CBS 8797]|uniref:Uncharacterized protein n=1 Tax=Huiozyma naganishii (strain ATCC MYA-139 / BCRC 22969 / CBS 8797 / KCTC 17520 / NBRC 10181 / NCYC 3082 / Yp74L-3) TaxID=1071383 RepID=J7RWW3_HUIN7|nr:hypothetical protein KNAG_0C03980 [Kazachstania naganishii CBS 8797]CCK69502.1 hypothetical protein KNAG_0C03980 [Kazachstania naganishii CBS 8797]
MSKDKMLIPQLTDEEALERHKRADETMKQVWSNIIDKYENVHTQGDVIDLHSGRIVEDNGHIRGLEQQPTAVPGQDGTLYNSATKKIMLPEGDAAGTAHLQDADNYSPWQVDPDDEDEMETQENILQGLTDDEDDDNGP